MEYILKEELFLLTCAWRTQWRTGGILLAQYLSGVVRVAVASFWETTKTDTKEQNKWFWIMQGWRISKWNNEATTSLYQTPRRYEKWLECNLDFYAAVATPSLSASVISAVAPGDNFAVGIVAINGRMVLVIVDKASCPGDGRVRNKPRSRNPGI